MEMANQGVPSRDCERVIIVSGQGRTFMRLCGNDTCRNDPVSVGAVVWVCFIDKDASSELDREIA
jgi:hypothetical protein